MCRKRNILVALLAVLGCANMAQICCGDEPTQEYRLKAAFIYNFARFIEWPDDAFADGKAPFVIAVVGDDPFNGALEQEISGKKVGGRSVVIRHFASSVRQPPVATTATQAAASSSRRRRTRTPGACSRGESGIAGM